MFDSSKIYELGAELSEIGTETLIARTGSDVEGINPIILKAAKDKVIKILDNIGEELAKAAQNGNSIDIGQCFNILNNGERLLSEFNKSNIFKITPSEENIISANNNSKNPNLEQSA